MRVASSLVMAIVVMSTGCVGVPTGIEPVRPFDLERYLGSWYELARYDHRYESGLERVQAEYSLDSDGDVSVRNRGFDPTGDRWKEATGRARFVGSSDTAHLKVSFFGPFYGSYVVFALDPDYRWAWVTSFDRSSLWLLSREPSLDDETWTSLLEIAASNGFDTGKLIRVPQVSVPIP